ncbi:hypothetical protein DM02DRAFT_108885 [Periconia macrospinosa]|uniref:Uncharacterized protein n=1 Tax=Periconia macrospinosa TaxID=97972 RepID=A0A2V1E3X9_9PLEO|nr:hypothetical protein DM02DRAFT_108885 [Periconia macrospinosa]
MTCITMIITFGTQLYDFIRIRLSSVTFPRQVPCCLILFTTVTPLNTPMLLTLLLANSMWHVSSSVSKPPPLSY